MIGGNQYELDIPSGAQTGLKLNRSFEVPEGMSVDLTIDFDLRKSIHMPSSGTDYKLRPTLRSVATPDSGIISGTIDPTLIPTERCAEDAVYAIYLFQGPAAVIDDLAVDGDEAPDPIITVNVDLDVSSGNYSFTIPYLEPNSYTVTATCSAQLDEPDQNDSELMGFYGTTDVVVTAGEAGTINFTESSVAPL
ncbi:hypothetical protein BOW53_14040 [Solemya pervernicosa gill symbiont]|uniref:DUF4382 domain-containing protein n=1 Tax=Solemya pervernicosa gill symbiont TaxID=642797 RepID=A0A1T2L150_9GAMM|nr:DUF4382 domain-containing protein [Solemya pervernicosa gill symbiont]OOZ38823.1 hypothetical protein BOW53_14040 [Solemya pervernicosa gill symbiont]